MSRSIKKFLEDGRSEATKLAEERALEFAEVAAADELTEPNNQPNQESMQLINTNTNFNNNSSIKRSHINTNNTSNPANQKAIGLQHQQSPKHSVTANSSAQSKLNSSLQKSPMMQQKAASQVEQTPKPNHINSIGMNNMIKANQQLNSSKANAV